MLSSILLIVVIPYAALTFALRAPTFIKRLVKNDLSYGIYIYAFPVQQLVCAYTVSRNIGWLVTLVVSGVLTLMFAALSWFLIERPALRLRPRTEPVVVEGLAKSV